MKLLPKTPQEWLTAGFVLVVIIAIIYLVLQYQWRRHIPNNEGFHTDDIPSEEGVVSAEELLEVANNASNNNGSNDVVDSEEIEDTSNAVTNETQSKADSNRVLSTDDMIHLDPVVINRRSSEPFVNMPSTLQLNTEMMSNPMTSSRTSEREGFNGGSAGSVMFDKLRK